MRGPGFRFGVSFVVFIDEDRIFWRSKPKRRRDIPVSILLTAVLSIFGRSEAGGRSCVEGSLNEQLIERGSGRRVR